MRETELEVISNLDLKSCRKKKDSKTKSWKT